MSEKVARTHTQASHRFKPQDNLARKVVFKSVLDNPFRIQWPIVPINVQNAFLASAISILDGIPAYFCSRDRENRKRKKIGPDSGAIQPEPPSILHHLTIGINQVTKRLESHIRSAHKAVVVPGRTASECRSAIKIILVCQGDVDPPLLIAHLPHLVATCNTSSAQSSTQAPQNFIKLVPLPKGAEASLAEALGLRRVAVMAIDVDSPELSAFSRFLDVVPTLSAPWLRPQGYTPQVLVPTHIKQVRTSAPQDMKAAKDQRAKGKLAAKERMKMKKMDGAGGG